MNLPTNELFKTLEKLCRGRPSTLKKEIYQIRDWLTKERSSRPVGYMSRPKAFSAYMAYHLPLHLPELFWILDQAFGKGGLPRVENILDLGSGPGTATLSLLLWLKSRDLREAHKVTLIDSSRMAMEAAEKLIFSISPTVKVQKIREQLQILDERTLNGSYDFIICSHVFNEFGNGPRFREKKYAILQNFMKALKPGCIAVFIEPPLREPTLDLMWIRDEIAQAQVFSIRGPCPSGIEHCTMRADNLGWCYTQAPRIWTKPYQLTPWDREIEKNFGITLNHPGFSYLIVQNKAPDATDKPTNHVIAITDDKAYPTGLHCTPDGAKEGPTPYRGAYLLPSTSSQSSARPRRFGSKPKSSG